MKHPWDVDAEAFDSFLGHYGLSGTFAQLSQEWMTRFFGYQDAFCAARAKPTFPNGNNPVENSIKEMNVPDGEYQDAKAISKRLKAIPVKTFLRINTGRAFISAEVPLGELCHEAAEAIDTLERLLENEQALRLKTEQPVELSQKDRDGLALIVRQAQGCLSDAVFTKNGGLLSHEYYRSTNVALHKVVAYLEITPKRKSGWVLIDDNAKQGQPVILGGYVHGEWQVMNDDWYSDRVMSDWREWPGLFDAPPTHYMAMATPPKAVSYTRGEYWNIEKMAHNGRWVLWDKKEGFMDAVQTFDSEDEAEGWAFAMDYEGAKDTTEIEGNSK